MENNLRTIREAAGLNQRQLSEKAHIPQSLVSAIETGTRQPWPKAVQRLCRVLKKDASAVFPNYSPSKAKGKE